MSQGFPGTRSTESDNLASGLSIRANSIWMFAGRVVYAACQWGVMVILTKSGTPEMVGQFALGLAVTAPVIMLTNLSLRAVQATDSQRVHRFRDYLSLRLLTTTVAFLTITAIAFLGGYGRETVLVILVVGLAKGLEAVSFVFYGLFQQNERMDRVAQSDIIKGLLSLIALGAGFHLTGSVLGGAAGLTAAWLLVLVLYDVPMGAVILLRRGNDARGNAPPSWFRWLAGQKPRWEWAPLGRLIQLTWPLGVAMMLNSLITNVPRYFVERYLGERELGLFAAMAYVMVAERTIIYALGQSASPRLARYYAMGRRRAFQTLLLKLLGIGLLVGGAGIAVALVAGREILRLLYRQEYAAQPDVFVWLMVAITIEHVAAFLGYSLTAARHFKIQPAILAGSVTISVVLCLVMVPTHGILGAAWAVAGTLLFQAVVTLLANIHAVRVGLGGKSDSAAD